MPIQERYDLVDKIINALAVQNDTLTPKIINVHGQAKISITCEQDDVHLKIKLDAEKEALAFMITSNDEYRHLIQLKFNKDNEIYDIDYIFLTKEFINSVSTAVVNEIKKMADIQINNRLQNYFKTHKKLGRNELCPCASGKKI